jgi:hypothetical protein
VLYTIAARIAARRANEHFDRLQLVSNYWFCLRYKNVSKSRRQTVCRTTRHNSPKELSLQTADDCEERELTLRTAARNGTPNTETFRGGILAEKTDQMPTSEILLLPQCKESQMKSSQAKLAEYARLVANAGADSPEAIVYLQTNQDDEDFAQLARLTNVLQHLLNANVPGGTEEAKSPIPSV